MANATRQRYRWPERYNVKLDSSRKEKIEDIRNTIYEEWIKEKKSGNPGLEDAVKIEKGNRKDQIIITWERRPVNPGYIYALDQYNPKMVHIPYLTSIVNVHYSDNRNHIVEKHKQLYSQFFHIKGILRNLLLNRLIGNSQKEKILVHYNFLSMFTHPSKENIKIYSNLNRSYYTAHPKYDEDTYKELIVLYAAKLMQLYVRTIIDTYRKNWNILNSDKYDKYIEELSSISRDLWFFDNDPIDEPSETLYYDDPLSWLDVSKIKV